MTLPRVLKLATAVGLLALLWVGLDGPAALRIVAQADPRWLLAALVTLTAQTLLSAWRWRLTAGRLGLRIAPIRAVREYYLAQVVNQSLPGGVAGDVGRALRARGDAGIGPAAGAVAIERLSGQIAMIALMLAGVAAVTLAPGGITLPAPVVLLALAVASAAAVAGMALWAAPRLRAWRGIIVRALLAADVWPRQALLSIGTAGLNLMSFDFCARATGTDLPVGAVLVLVPLILVTMVLPVTISGWGLREGAAAVLFPLAGASATAGLAGSLAFGLMFLVSTLPGIGVLLTTRRAKIGAT